MLLFAILQVISAQDQTIVSCSTEEIVIQIGNVGATLNPISFGTCPTSSPQFEGNNTIRVRNNNGMARWDYDCGFIRSETDTHVTYENQITFVEEEFPNPYGIIVATNLIKAVYTQKIQCSYRKFMHVELCAQIFPDCEKCQHCSYDENCVPTCKGL